MSQDLSTHSTAMALELPDPVSDLLKLYEPLSELEPDERTTKLAETSGIEDAAMALLLCRFTAVGRGLPKDDPRLADAHAAEVALAVVELGSMSVKRRFLREVLLNLAHPRIVDALWPIVASGIPAARLEPVLRAAATGDNPLHLLNATELAVALRFFERAYLSNDIVEALRTAAAKNEHPLIRDAAERLSELLDD